MTAKRILLIQLRQLGDILLTSPCIREIKRENPAAHISFLCHKMGESFLKDNPDLDELILYREDDSLKKSTDLLLKIRRDSYDLVIDFMNNPRSALFTFFSAAPKRCAFNSARFWAYNLRLTSKDTVEYIVQEKFNFLRACGFNPKNEALSLPWFSSDREPWLAMHADNPEIAASQLRVVLSPTHRREIRKWPVKRYAKLADLLVEKWGASITWVWGPGEEDEVKALQKECLAKTFLAPATSLRELAALMAHHDLFIGNSNGPSHIAVAANICTLQLHGHTDARSWCPLNDRHQAIQCADFGKIDQPDLNSIQISDVWNKLEGMKNIVLEQTQKRIECKDTVLDWQKV